MINKRMEDWEWEEWNEKYEAFERLANRALFWAIVVMIIGALVFNMITLTSMVKEMLDSRPTHENQTEAAYGQI
jgi:hypothetical protein